MKKVQFPSFNTKEMEELDEENIKEEEEEELPKNPATKVTKNVRDEIIKKLFGPPSFLVKHYFHQTFVQKRTLFSAMD